MKKADRVIVVLGAPTTDNGGPGPDLKQRLDHCIELMATSEYSDSVVVVSGGSPTTYGSSGLHSEGQIMHDYLVANGVKSKRILVEDKALHTFHNALYSKTLLRNQGLLAGDTEKLELVVLTTDWHMERSHLCFKAVFIDTPGVILIAETVASDDTAPETIARVSKERTILDNGWIARCIKEEQDHPDMPKTSSRIST